MHIRFLLRLLALSFVALGPAVAVAAPSPVIPQPQQPAPAPPYAAAMRGGSENDVKRDDLPRYDLDLSVDPQARRLNGSMTLQFPNTTGTTLSDVVLRLYPAFPPDLFGGGGNIKMDVSEIVANGVATRTSYEAQGTAVRIALQQPVAPDEQITISLRYTANMTAWQRRDGTFPLPSYYPMLAAWQDGWRTDVTRFPDRVFATSALYHARVTVPKGWTAIGSGSTINVADNGSTRTFEMVTGPVREWAFSVGRFVSVAGNHADVEVRVWHREGDGLEAAAKAMADHIVGSIAAFDGRFGPYPFKALEFHVINNAGQGYDIGVEYPGFVIMLLNGKYTADTRYVTAHEVAHQWFYGVIGNDIYNEPWLDESFAQYAGTLVEEQWAGPAAFARTYDRHVARLAARSKLPAGLSIGQYKTWNTYYAAVYGRGAQFLHTLRGEIGDEAFYKGIRDYYSEHKYGVAHSHDVIKAMEQSSGRDLDAIFGRWLGR